MSEAISGFAEINGGKLYYEIMGEGDPLVFSHAAFVDRGMWDDQMEEFAQHYRVIRYDMRGFGKSDLAEGPVSRRDDLRQVLQHLEIERATLIGCSMSGTAVLDLAIEHPELVSALVIVNALPSGYEEEGEWVPTAIEAEMIAAVEAGNNDVGSELQIRIWVDGGYRDPGDVDPDVRRRAAEMNRRSLENRTAFIDDRDPLDPPAFGRLGEVRAQTLIVVGDLDDPIVARAAAIMADGITEAKMVTIAGTAHVPNMEKPQEFNQAVLSFLRG